MKPSVVGSHFLQNFFDKGGSDSADPRVFLEGRSSIFVFGTSPEGGKKIGAQEVDGEVVELIDSDLLKRKLERREGREGEERKRIV
jgi:hypothetical protein